MATSPAPAWAASASPAGTTAASSARPNRRVCLWVSTPFWMKRLPPVKG